MSQAGRPGLLSTPKRLAQVARLLPRPSRRSWRPEIPPRRTSPRSPKRRGRFRSTFPKPRRQAASPLREARRREPAVVCQQPSLWGAHSSVVANSHDHAVDLSVETVANRSRRCQRAGHRFRRTHRSAVAGVQQAPAPALRGKAGPLRRLRTAPDDRRGGNAHLWGKRRAGTQLSIWPCLAISRPPPTRGVSATMAFGSLLAHRSADSAIRRAAVPHGRQEWLRRSCTCQAGAGLHLGSSSRLEPCRLRTARSLGVDILI
jgi:hypothetical protein